MKNVGAAVGIGCGLALLVIAGLVVALVLWVPKMVRWGGQQIALEQTRGQWAQQWQPPAGEALPEDFFPGTVAGYARAAQDEEATIPPLQFDMAGDHAVYEASGSRIDVYVYRASELEKEALFGRIGKVYDDTKSGFKLKTEMPYRMYYSSSTHGQNHLWWTKGWLFVFRTQDSEDRETFVEAFLKETSQAAGEAGRPPAEIEMEQGMREAAETGEAGWTTEPPILERLGLTVDSLTAFVARPIAPGQLVWPERKFAG